VLTLPRLTPEDRPLLPAIGYVRVSMMLGEKISPDIQMDAISACAARKGYYVPDGEWPDGGWIIELDVTGRNFNRDITKAVVAIEQGKTHAIIVLDFSRFGRDREGNPIHLGRIERAGGELLSATEDVDARTPSGRLARGIHFEFAAYYSDVIGARWAEAFQNRLKRGLPPLGGDYFGYVRRGRQPHPLFRDRTLLDPADGPERYEPDIAGGTGAILADQYHRWLQEGSFYKLARKLNERGIGTLGGAEWGESEVAWMLDRGFGAGLISVHNPDCRCGNPSSCRARVVLPGAHEPVISTQTWDSYVQTRQDMQTSRRRRSLDPTHPFHGFIICGHCRGGMHMKTEKDLHGYICGARVRQGAKTQGVKCKSVFVRRSLVTDAVLDILAEWAHDIEAAAERPEGTAPNPIVTESAQLERELKKVEADLAHQTDLVSSGVIFEEEYIPARDRLRAKRDRLQKRLADLTARMVEKGLDARDAVPVIEGLLQEWEVLSVQDRRRLLMEVIQRVEVWRDRLAPARVVVVPRWDGGEPIVRELPGRHRMEAVRGAVLHVLKHSPDGLRHGGLEKQVTELVPASRAVFNQALKTLAEEGLLIRKVLPYGQGTVYHSATGSARPPQARTVTAGQAARAAIVTVLTDRREGARFGDLLAVAALIAPVSRATFVNVLRAMTAEGAVIREPLQRGRGTVYQLAGKSASAR
jgi:site-specific DNA recombinase